MKAIINKMIDVPIDHHMASKNEPIIGIKDSYMIWKK